MGLDKNNVPDSPVMYYNMGSWKSSEAPGVLLFRPYLYDGGTGTEQKRSTLESLSIYPNPASEKISFQLPSGSEREEITLYIYDSNGRQLQHSLLRSQDLDVAGFTPGLYYVRVQIKGHVYYSKVLIHR